MKRQPLRALYPALRVVEVAVAVALFALPLATRDMRTLVGAVLGSAIGAAGSFVALVSVDTWGTLANGLALAARVALLVAPAVPFARRVPRRRLAWLLPWSLVLVVLLPVSMFAASTLAGWITLCVVSVVSTWAVRFAPLRWLVAAPLIALVASPPVLHHHPDVSNALVPADGRDARCAEADGRALTPPAVGSSHYSYYAVTRVTKDLFLLTGEGNESSWWLTRSVDGALHLGPRSEASGNLWKGCALANGVWFTKVDSFIRVTPPGPNGEPPESVTVLETTGPTAGRDFDFVGVGCDPERGRAWFGEVSQQGVWEVQGDSAPVRFEVGGYILLPALLPDGRLVVGSTSHFRLVDADGRGVVSSVPSALASNGLDVCAGDGSIAVSDLAGRVRVFRPDAEGSYRFEWGRNLTAPRRVAFSPDCEQLAVTSGDDHTVWVLDTASHEVRCTYHVGPALRDVTYLDERSFVVTDVCGVVELRCE